MSELKDLAWQAQRRSTAPDLETLVSRSRIRVRRRRVLAVAAGVIAVAVPAVVVASRLPGDSAAPTVGEVRPSSGRDLAHSPDAKLDSFYPLPGGNWLAQWSRCRETTVPKENPCWSTAAFKSAAGVEFTEPINDYLTLDVHGDLVYGFRSGGLKDRLLVTVENGRPVERPLVLSGTTTTIGDDLLLNDGTGLYAVDPRTGRGRTLQLPADLRAPNSFTHDTRGRWWLVKRGLLASTADGGRTWTRRPVADHEYGITGFSPDGQTIVVQKHLAESEGPGEYQRSRDGGQTWTTFPDPGKNVFELGAVFDDGTAIATDLAARATVKTSLLHLEADGTVRDAPTQYSLEGFHAAGDQVAAVISGPAITTPQPVPTSTPTPLPPNPPPARQAAVSDNRGQEWRVVEPR